MLKHADRLELVNRWLESKSIVVAQSASPYFDGVIIHEKGRLPFLVTQELFQNLTDNPDYYKYHFGGEVHLVFNFMENDRFVVYYHGAGHELNYTRVNQKDFTVTLSDFW